MSFKNVNVNVGGPKKDAPYTYKEVILKPNKSFAEQVTDTDRIYVIKWDFDLGGKEVTIPKNCALNFNGGSLNNGTVIGQDTKIYYSSPCFENIDFGGDWNVPKIYSWMLKDIVYENKLRTLFKLQNENISNDVFIDDINKPYIIVPSGSMIKGPADGIDIYSNTHVYNSGIVKIKPNAQYGYTVFNLVGNDICFEGGTLIGDKNEHDYSGTEYPTFEWGHGIRVKNNNYSNIVIRNVNISEFIGDGIIVKGFNIKIENCIIHDCRRQGITIAKCDNAIINNFIIYNIVGTAPQGAIDIEPDSDMVRNIKITNGYIYDCIYGITSYNTESYYWENFEYSNLVIERVERAFNITTIDKVYINNIKITEYHSSTGGAISISGARNLIINNAYVEADDTIDTDNYLLISFRGLIADSVLVQNSTFKGKNCVTLREITFRNCIFDGNNCVIEKTTNPEVHSKFENCKFNGRLVLSNPCTFRDCQFTDEKVENATVQIGIKCIDTTFTDCVYNIANQDINNVIMVYPNYSANIENCKFDTSIENTGSLINFGHGSGLIKNNINNTNRQLYTNSADNHGKIIVDYGSSIQRPTVLTNSDIGFRYYDRNKRKPIYWNGETWLYESGVIADTPVSGTFADRPRSSSLIYVGFEYFCTDRSTTEGGNNGIKIIYKGNEVWVDALGRVVS